MAQSFSETGARAGLLFRLTARVRVASRLVRPQQPRAATLYFALGYNICHYINARCGVAWCAARGI